MKTKMQYTPACSGSCTKKMKLNGLSFICGNHHLYECNSKKFPVYAVAPEMLEAINHAISDLDNHIAQYPNAKTLLPELRAYLAKCRDKAIQ